MNYKLRKLLISLAVLISGIVVIAFGVADMSHIKSFPQTEVTVTKVEITESLDSDGTTTESTDVYVTYTVEGKQYNGLLSDAPDNVKEGDRLSARYNPEKPIEEQNLVLKKGE